MTYDNNLLQHQQKVALKKQLEANLNDLREQRKAFDKQVIELRVAHRSEQEDVEKLEGKSLANYFYQVIGKLDDKLTEERRQALSFQFLHIFLLTAMRDAELDYLFVKYFALLTKIIQLGFQLLFKSNFLPQLYKVIIIIGHTLPPADGS